MVRFIGDQALPRPNRNHRRQPRRRRHCEPSLIAERVRAGLRRARADGKRLGRPLLQVDERQLRLVAAQKLPVRIAAKALGVSPSSYARLIRAQAASAAVRASASAVDETAQLSI